MLTLQSTSANRPFKGGELLHNPTYRQNLSKDSAMEAKIRKT